MPLARLENFLKNLNGNTLYVDPNELDSTDSIENRGNSRLRPFKTIQRALLEAARFSYVAGSNNDLFDQTTILISPGTHYIDNRPGYYLNGSSLYDANNSLKTITEFNILSNFDIFDSSNELYAYNSVDGGVILPKGTSLVATDLRKTKIRPLFVPDPNQSQIKSSAIFKLTGSCYFFGFSIFDGDPLGKVYNTYSTNTVTPSYSHHKLTAFEYADGINDSIKNGSDLGRTDLEMYYYKVALGFGQQSSRSIIDGYDNLQPNVDEFRIVGELGSGPINISDIFSGDGTNVTSVITVTTEAEHNLNALTPIVVSGVGVAEGSPTDIEYNGNFIVSQILSPTSFTYLLQNVPTGSLNPSFEGATVKVISDTVTSSSPYVFNCSLKSVYGMNGLHADGSKATGFKSMVTAQFTGISLQKDDRAFVKYSEDSGTYIDQSSLGVSNFLHQDINSIYKPEWSSSHIKASNDAFIQCVSIFAIGYANQFVASDGGDQSITNSNSNFGQRALNADGFRASAFSKDDQGFITHIIPPKDVFVEDQNINTYIVDNTLPNSNTKIYLKEFNDVLNPPSLKIRGYSIGGRQNDKIYYNNLNVENFADITPNYKIEVNITSVSYGPSENYLGLTSVVGISTGLPVKIFSKNAVLPDGIENNKTYYARPYFGSNIRIYENFSNCISDTTNTGNTAVDIKNAVGLSTNNLYVVSKVSDLNSGDVGSPIQWDDTVKNWYIGITTNVSSPNFVSNITSNNITPTLYLKRVIDTRTDEDRIYRFRYVIPKDFTDASVPATGFIIQKSSQPLNSTYAQSSDTTLASLSGNQLTSIRNTNVIVDAFWNSNTATIVTKNPHELKVGNKISIYNLKSSAEPAPVGLGTGTGFNGTFEVASVVDDLTFTYTITRNPGTITVGVSTFASWLSLPRNCNQSSSFRVPPYTVYSANRDSLPYFTCDEVENNYQLYEVKEVQRYVPGSIDGVYHLSLDVFKNTPTVSPFNIDQYKLGQNLDYFYPQKDFDNLTVDPEPTASVASRKTIGLVDINDLKLSSSKESAIQYIKDFNFGKSITGFVKVANNVTITTSENHGIAGIKRVEQINLGSGYLNGTYYDIPLCGGTGSNATINFTVSGGSPVAASFEISNPGSGYSIGDTLTIKGIPGSTSSTTVSIPSSGLNFDANDPDAIQVLGASNSGNNGAFIISSVTANTITYSNSLGSTEAITNAVFVMSGPGFPISTAVYNSTIGITTITTGNNSPHSLSVGNKVLFNVNGLGICTVTSISGTQSFSVKGNASTATRSFYVGFVPTLRDTNSTNENINVRHYASFANYKNRITTSISPDNLSIYPSEVPGLKKGDFIQIENEIMLVTNVSGSEVDVKRALFGTQATSHPSNAAIKTIKILPTELRRPSILRASGHTFEYIGFGPGNYSTAMPNNQTKSLNENETRISQALPSKGGSILYSGMNSNGEFFIGRRKWNASTGIEIDTGIEQQDPNSADFDNLTVNRIVVNEELDASTATTKLKDVTVSGKSEFESGIKVTGITTSTTFVGGGTIPIGGIIMWSGAIINIPARYALCDGTNGTPDLRNRFIVGAGAGYAVDATGGSADAVVVSHNHIGVTAENGSHIHTTSFDGVGDGFGGTKAYAYQSPGAFDLQAPGGNFNRRATSWSMNSAGSHQHTFTTSTEGESGVNKNIPPYYALAFIMRVS